MKLSFFGADREVTGSCHCIEACGKKILVDCGLAQGSNHQENSEFPFDVSTVDAVVLTHAHIDHSGRLPLLAKLGYKGKIYSESATCDLLSIMLVDSAHIQEMDAMWDSKKAVRSGAKPVEPLYSIADAEESLKLLAPCSYDQEIELVPGIKVKFIDAGHILGSALVEMYIEEEGISKKIVFSGDLGNLDQPIIKDPTYIENSDYIVMESTYGDRMHEPEDDYPVRLAEVIDKTLARRGNVVIPAFAVGRTQELLFFIREIKERGLVKSVPDFPVYVDSPLAKEATRIYGMDLVGNADIETKAVMDRKANPISFSNLKFTESADDSKMLNTDMIPKVIISASGMCDAGRIRHHLKHNLWRKESSIVFVGFQALGTMGRNILDGAKKVKIFGEEIAVSAEIYNFRGLSAHADKEGLIRWVGFFKNTPKQIFIVHGEDKTCDSFAETLKELGYNTYVPNFEASYDLATDTVISAGTPREQLIPKAEEYARVKFDQKGYLKPKGQVHIPPAYAKLLSAGEMLLYVIKESKNLTTGDLQKFTDEIIRLCKKWQK